MTLPKQVIVAALLACATSGTLAQAPANPAQAYPSKLIRLVDASAPGGGSNLVGRIIAQKLGPLLGES